MTRAIPTNPIRRVYKCVCVCVLFTHTYTHTHIHKRVLRHRVSQSFPPFGVVFNVEEEQRKAGYFAVRLAIRFLKAKNIRQAEIHGHVYDENAIKEGNLRKHCIISTVARKYCIISTVARKHCIISTVARKHCIISTVARKYCIISTVGRKHCIISTVARKYCIISTVARKVRLRFIA